MFSGTRVADSACGTRLLRLCVSKRKRTTRSQRAFCLTRAQERGCREGRRFRPGGWPALALHIKVKISSDAPFVYARTGTRRPRRTTRTTRRTTRGGCARARSTPTRRRSPRARTPSTWTRTRRRCCPRRAPASPTPGARPILPRHALSHRCTPESSAPGACCAPASPTPGAPTSLLHA